jgi:hypothetical protein
MNGAFGVTYEQLQPKLSLSAGPSATKHGPNTSGELIRPPSASIDLRHAAEEDNRARGCCTAATGPKSGDSLSLRGSKPEEESHQSNTPRGRVGPRDQRHVNHPSTSAKEEREDGSAR